MSRTACLVLLLGTLAAGCQTRAVRYTPGERQRNAARAKLQTAMTEPQVTKLLGSPTVFRKAKGRGSDVAIYRVGDGAVTIYFYQGKLTRVQSGRVPVNR